MRLPNRRRGRHLAEVLQSEVSLSPRTWLRAKKTAAKDRNDAPLPVPEAKNLNVEKS